MDISIIIPVYNVSEYLRACLRSVAKAIENIDAEVLLIDDGSTDDSGEKAKEFILENPKFFYFYEENQGLGHARNYGAELSKGKYLMFLDSDDKVEPDIFENMLAIAEKTQSELTICNVSRFNSKSSWASSLHQMLFHNMPVGETTHITKNNALLYDTTAWNKLILRSFYEKHAFRFPENHVLYEDIPVTLPMHYLANQVACVRKCEYLWRVRDGKTKSITQSNTEIKNITDRLMVLRLVFDFYRSVGDAALLEQLQIKVLKIDLIVFVNVLDRLPKKLTELYVKMLNEFIDQYIDRGLLERLSVIQRQKYLYLLDRDVEGIKKVLQYAKKYHSSTRIEEREGKLCFDLPKDVFTIDDRSVYVDYEDIEPNTTIDAMEINNDVITIDAHLFYPKVDIRSKEDLRIEAVLVGDLYKQTIPVEVIRSDSSAVTAKYGAVYHAASEEVDYYCYDGAGFRLKIDLKAIAGQLRDPDNFYILCTYKTPINEGTCAIRKAAKRYYRKYVKYIFGTEGHLFRVSFDTERLFFLRAEPEMQIAELAFGEDGAVSFGQFDGLIALPGDSNEEDENETISEEDVESTEEEIAKQTDDDEEEEHELSIGEFLSGLEGQDCLEIVKPESFSLECGRKVWKVHDFYVYVGRRTSSLLLQKRLWVPVWKLRRTADDRVEYELEVYADGGPYTQAAIYIDDSIAGVKRVLSTCTLTRSGEKYIGSGNVIFDEQIISVLYSKSHKVLVSLGDQISSMRMFWEEPFDFNFEFDTMSACLFAEASGTVVLKTYLEWGEGEKTKGERNFIRSTRYKEYRKEAIRDDLVLFEAKWGAKYNDNPRAFYEYLDAHHPEYQCVWSFKDPRMPILGNGRRVRRGSDEYYRVLATAKYLVNDVNFEDAFVKRDGQIMIETMHGTPYKSFGLDVDDELPRKSSIWKFVRKTMNWDYLISQGRFLDKKAYPMLRFYKTLLKTGYPRTDSIITGEGIDKAALKKELNIPADKKVILYAPTFRIKGRFKFNFDFEELMNALGDDYVFAVRVHYLASSHYRLPSLPNLVDLTAYSNMEDLYQIADVLITDYSSAMFDFALTGKPMLFYVYDLKEYEEKLRGVYMDLRKEAPGPLVYTQEDLVDSLKNIDKISEEYREKVQAFMEEYLTHERPDSCERIYQEVFVDQIKSKRTKRTESFEKWIDKKMPFASGFAEKTKIHLMTLDKTISRKK